MAAVAQNPASTQVPPVSAAPQDPGKMANPEDPNVFVTQRAGKNVIANPLLNFLKEEVETLVDDKKSLQSTLLLQKKKELSQIHRQLERKRIEFRKRMDECYEKQNELKAKQKQIRERVIKFEKFLKDNEAKRQRANMKSVQERKLKELKEQEIEQLRNQVKTEQFKNQNIQKLLGKYRKFDIFLERVISTLPSDYLDIPEPHIHDILMRYKTLEETRIDSMKILQEMSDAIEVKQNILSELMKKNDDTVLVYNSRMGALQKKLDRMRIDTTNLEMSIIERDNTGKKRHRILGETTMAINNLYTRVGIRNIQDNITLTEKLNAIKERIIDLMFIASKADSSHLGGVNYGGGVGNNYSNTNNNNVMGNNYYTSSSINGNNHSTTPGIGSVSVNNSTNNSQMTITNSENLNGSNAGVVGKGKQNHHSIRTNVSSASSQQTSPTHSNLGSRTFGNQ